MSLIIRTAALSIITLGFFISLTPNALAQSCPSGTVKKGGLPPKKFAMWCEKNGNRHGPFYGFYSNGRKAVVTNFKEGKRHGSHRDFFPDGSIQKAGKFNEGKLDGTWTRYYAEGHIKDQGNWKMGKPEGKWKFWRANGDVRAIGQYVCGRKSGSWKIAKKNSPTLMNKSFASYSDCSSYSGFELWSFEATAMYAVQNGSTDGSMYTFQATWVPRYRIWSWLSVVARVGVSLFRGYTDADRFFVVDYGGMFKFHPSFFGPISVGLGGGAQTWITHRTEPTVTAAIHYNFNSKFLGLIDRIVLEMTGYLFPSNNVDQFKAGVGITL